MAYPHEYSVIDGYDDSAPGLYKQVNLPREVLNLAQSYPFKSQESTDFDEKPYIEFDNAAINFISESVSQCAQIKNLITQYISPETLPAKYAHTYNQAVDQLAELRKIEVGIDSSLKPQTIAGSVQSDEFRQHMQFALCPECRSAQGDMLLACGCGLCVLCCYKLFQQYSEPYGGMIPAKFYEDAMCSNGHKFTPSDIKRIVGDHDFDIRSRVN